MRLVLLCCAVAGGLATLPAAALNARKSAEYAMVVSGTVDIASNGSVTAYGLEHPDRLPQPVRDLVGKSVPGYRFRPLAASDAPGDVRARMYLRVIAADAGDAGMRVRIANAAFTEDAAPAEETITFEKRVVPRFPSANLSLGVSGIVFLLLKVDPSGNVTDVMAEQVNLDTYSTPSGMQRQRSDFAVSTIAAARMWKFRMPTHGNLVGSAEQILRIPVSFSFKDDPAPAYGRWVPYFPGPRMHSPAFASADADAHDALPADAIQRVGSGPRLLTPPEG